jgi:uncharacterized protein YhfF
MNRLKRMQFWGRDPEDDHLVREILEGEKTATVTPADTYHLPEGPCDDGGWEVGDLVEIYDLKERLRCIVRITDVYPVAFGDIPERLWRGEACRNAEHFREAHRECWPELDLTDGFALMATHFELVEVAGDTAGG